jgi:tetratricopeptide (TPR) repeat protein
VTGGEAVAAVTPERRIRGDLLVVTLPVAIGEALPSGMAMTLAVAATGPRAPGSTASGGAALLTAPLALLAGEGSVRLAQAGVDVRVLPPGEYVARVTVAMPDAELARVVAPFSIDRTTAGAGAPTPRPVPGAAGRAAPGAGASRSEASLVPGFRLDEVLEPAVLGPFLDDLAARAPDRARRAIEQAKAGRFVEAAEAAASKDPNDPARPFLEGLSLLSRRQLQAASQAFRDTLQVAPDYFVGAFYIGACYAAGGRDQQAVNAWQTSLVALDRFPIVFRLIGEAQARMGQPDRALRTLEEASAKWPEDADLRVRLARAALDARRYDRVAAIADAALAPADPDVLFVGMQAVFEEVTRGTGPPSGDALPRLKRYREAYGAAGGPRQALADEWIAAVEKKVSAAR